MAAWQRRQEVILAFKWFKDANNKMHFPPNEKGK